MGGKKGKALAQLDGFARNRGLWILRETGQWKVYDITTGAIVATVYPANWRVLPHFGSGNEFNAKGAFHAIERLLAMRKGT